MILRRLPLTVMLFSLIFPVISYADGNGRKDAKEEIVTEENSLLFDAKTPMFEDFPFDIDESERLKPKENDFELLYFAPMSNKLGERWVLITLKNTSSGRRFLKNEHIIATFANGKQAKPTKLDESFDAGQILTKTISFGANKFPIVILEIQP